ncbi:MAG: prephenate dehydratase [Candidatus Omnitrophota bacterium]|nr:prephenate dehydratase [Candidatus Omnitrophota bacterium]
MKLTSLRQKVDSIDKAIIELLNKRANLSLSIRKLKIKKSKGIYSPDREKQVLSRLAKTNKGPLNQQAVEAIYREIMSSSLALGQPLVIACLGPEASFTHQASLKKFGSLVTYSACDTISEVFNEVEKGNADYGVVPIENSIEGAVTHTMDMLVDSDLKICAQIILEISHNLLSKYDIKSIKKIYSNPQVFGQCRMWLEKNLPRVECIEVSSTAKAAQICTKEKNSGCIASILAAKVYGLKVIAKSIEDVPHNITRFLVIGRDDVGPTGEDKTSIMFSIKDKVGALHDMLVPFQKFRINLTRIESRPSKKKAWDYYFFVDLKGHRQDRNVKLALSILEDKCKYLKILGSYPVSE